MVLLKAIRLILGSMIAFLDWLTRGSRLKRTEAAQKQVEQELAGLSLYQFKLCPFCIKTRRRLHQLNLPIQLLDAKNDQTARNELLQQGGKIKVPCLRIEDNQTIEWMYESNDIIHYLNNRFNQSV